MCFLFRRRGEGDRVSGLSVGLGIGCNEFGVVGEFREKGDGVFVEVSGGRGAVGEVGGRGHDGVDGEWRDIRGAVGVREEGLWLVRGCLVIVVER